MPDSAGTACDDGQGSTLDDRCDGAGNCIGTIEKPPCKADAEPNCDTSDSFLPVVTHWNAGSEQYLGTDQPDLWEPEPMPEPAKYVSGDCYPTYKVKIPDYEDYIADTYCAIKIPTDEAKTMLSNACHDTGVPVRLLPPMPWHAQHEIIEAPESYSCKVQIVHASQIDGSLVTVFLPPTWRSDAPASSYPIVLNSFYDLNDDVFRTNGPLLANLVARSGLDGRRGVIGVLSNGGGAIASRGFDEGMLQKTAETIAWIAEEFHGDPQEVITFGGSRGGYTSLAIASNPLAYPYRVILAIAIAAPSILGQHIALSSPTYPGIFSGVAADTGLADAWKYEFRYPSCAGHPDLSGLNGWQAALRVLTGTSDPDQADAQRSLTSPAFLDGLQEAGTQVYLEVTGHDMIVPYHLQFIYGATIIDRSIPTEAHVVLRNGHMTMGANYAFVLDRAIGTLSDPSYDSESPTPMLITPSVHYWIPDRQSGEYTEIFPQHYPFTFEGPYRVVTEQSFPLVFVGEQGTDYELIIKSNDTEVWSLSGTIPDNAIDIVTINDFPLNPGGPYEYSLRIRKKGLEWEQVPSTNTPSGDPAELWIMDSEPVVDGQQAMSDFFAPTAPAIPGTNWGLSEF